MISPLLASEDPSTAGDGYFPMHDASKPSGWRPKVAAMSAFIGLALVAVVYRQSLGTVGGVALTATTASSSPYDAGGHLAFVHLFEWDWASVAHECETWLGPKGFDAVQISPATEGRVGDAWWTRYQPASHKLISRSGNETQLRDMVRRCNAAGVMVVFDVVMNHMAQGTGVGIAGSQFFERNYPDAGLSAAADFHHAFLDPNNNCYIQDYTNKHQVQFCDLGGLPDLCTECSHTRTKLVEYLRSLSSMGPRVGFRIDAAKHQDPSALKNVLNDAGSTWNFQEVIYGQGEAVTPEQYVGIGLVTEFRYAWLTSDLFRGLGDKFNRLDTLGENWGMIPSRSAVTFTDNHDTQRSTYRNPLTYKDGDLYFLYNIFTLATPYGKPKVMSGFDFTWFDQGPPAYPANRCTDGWLCEHRRPDIANMVAWRRMAGQSGLEQVTKDSTGDHLAFSRGGVAFVALNRGGTTWQLTLQTGLPAGEYCNIIVDADLSSCPRIKVSDNGEAYIVVPPIKAVAFHTAVNLLQRNGASIVDKSMPVKGEEESDPTATEINRQESMGSMEVRRTKKLGKFKAPAAKLDSTLQKKQSKGASIVDTSMPVKGEEESDPAATEINRQESMGSMEVRRTNKLEKFKAPAAKLDSTLQKKPAK